MPFEAEQHAVPLERLCCFLGICTFGFLEIAIMGYCIAEKITTGEFPTPIFIFGILGMLIFNGIKLYETRRMTEMADEDEE